MYFRPEQIVRISEEAGSGLSYEDGKALKDILGCLNEVRPPGESPKNVPCEYKPWTEPPPFDDGVRTTQDFPELGIKLQILDEPAKDSQVLAAVEELSNYINTEKLWDHQLIESGPPFRAVHDKIHDILAAEARRTDKWDKVYEFIRYTEGWNKMKPEEIANKRMAFIDNNPWSHLLKESTNAQ
jgi:hypothetical protein